MQTRILHRAIELPEDTVIIERQSAPEFDPMRPPVIGAEAIRYQIGGQIKDGWMLYLPSRLQWRFVLDYGPALMTMEEKWPAIIIQDFNPDFEIGDWHYPASDNARPEPGDTVEFQQSGDQWPVEILTGTVTKGRKLWIEIEGQVAADETDILRWRRIKARS